MRADHEYRGLMAAARDLVVSGFTLESCDPGHPDAPDQAAGAVFTGIGRRA